MKKERWNLPGFMVWYFQKEEISLKEEGHVKKVSTFLNQRQFQAVKNSAVNMGMSVSTYIRLLIVSSFQSEEDLFRPRAIGFERMKF